MPSPTKITLTVALFKTTYSNNLVSNCDLDKPPGWIQTSQPVTVTFELLPQSEVILAEIKQLDQEIEETANRLHQELTRLKDRKNTLLALTQQ